MPKRSPTRFQCARFLVLLCCVWSGVTFAKPAPSGFRAAPQSPAMQALQSGDFLRARSARAEDREERTWIKARIHLAQFELEKAANALANLSSSSPYHSELSWLLAHARKDPVAIAASAARYCAQGDPTGRSCVDAEFYENRVVTPRLSLRSTTRISMVTDAPFPMVRAQVGKQIRGVVFDTGASQSVISLQSARNMGLAMTQGAFPIAVAGGEGLAQARLAVLPMVDFGPMQLWTVPVLVVDMPELDSAGVGLILSPQQVFDGKQVLFDFPRGEMQIGEELGVNEIKSTRAVPYFAAGFDLVIRAQLAGGPSRFFGLDTGMEGPFVVSSTYWDRLQPSGKGQTESVAGAVLYGAGAEAQVNPVYASEVRLGKSRINLAERGVRAEMKRYGTFDIAGLLGNGIWKDRQVILDTRKHQWRMSLAAIP